MPDLCKPPQWRQLSGPIISGCLMHQQVDKLTDSHEEFIRIKSSLSSERRRFAGIILDVSFDHLLAINWDQWHEQNLRDFVNECHIDLLANSNELPERAQHIIKTMVAQDWLFNYRKIEGISQAFKGLSRRFKYDNPLQGSEQELESQLDYWQVAFSNVLTDLVQNNFG